MTILVTPGDDLRMLVAEQAALKRVAVALGGHLRVASEHGRGTTVRELPVEGDV